MTTVTDTLFPPVTQLEAHAGESIDQQFARWHAANPWVLGYLERKVDALLAAGATRVGLKQVWEVLRYDHRIATRGDTFKANNNYTSRYARLLIERRPELAGVIETRELRS